MAVGETGWFRQYFNVDPAGPVENIQFDPVVFTWPHSANGLTVLRTRVFATAWWSNTDTNPQPGPTFNFKQLGIEVAFGENESGGPVRPPGFPGSGAINVPNRYKPTIMDALQMRQQFPLSIDPSDGIVRSWQAFATLGANAGDSKAQRRFDAGRQISIWVAAGPYPDFSTVLGSSFDFAIDMSVDVLLLQHS